MAPPIAPMPQSPPQSQGYGGQQAPPQQPPAGGSAYPWTEVPAGQQVPITRAVFDQGGYQLFAGSGETIIVPFVNQNMYVMKFGRSSTGGMYFVNDGAVPTL